ncbi:hypothetical protein AHF37_05948 [Paragonimus kellicotti]|nr:hypothetical protein AHF37_05948 [Paragonimus kellicotti]
MRTVNIIVAVSSNGGIGFKGRLPWRLKPPSGTYLVRSFTECMNLLSGDLCTQVDKIFIIGGSQLYREVLQQTLYPVRIFCTHVENNVECDTFFPEVAWDKLKQLKLPEVPSEPVEENGYSYRFVVYEYGTQ